MKIQLIIVLLLSLFAGNSFARQDQDFQTFWTEFRQAVKDNDKTKVASLTRFPFKTRGESDDDPVKTHTKQSFLNIWDKILQTDPGLNPEPETMAKFVERKTAITSKEQEPGTGEARVGSFVFEKVKGKWLLTMAFLNE